MSITLTASRQAAIDTIIKKGFPYMKFEFEAQLSREGDFSYEGFCEEFLTHCVSEEARNALVFSRFYEDGSVDSEWTFTIATKDVGYLPEYIRAWNTLAEENGNGMDIEGAGFHISVLTQSRYPGGHLNRQKLINFEREVTKLLPALLFLASHNAKSRSLYYRAPQISDGNKYSAIYTHGGSCLEYRIFETCWDKPDAVFDKIEVIANTLKYYSKRKIRVKLDKPVPFGDEGNHLSRFYNNAEKLALLNQTLPYLKPKSKSIEQLKRERSFKIDQAELSKQAKIKARELAQEFREYTERWEQIVEREITRLEMYAREDTNFSFVASSRETAIEYLRRSGILPQKPCTTLDEYVQMREERTSDSRYVLMPR